MKTLKRLNIDALKKANPILGSIEQRMIVGGAGPGDCVYRCIGKLVGIDQDTVRNTYARYLMVNSGNVVVDCGGVNNECGNNMAYWQEYADAHGVDNNHLNWIMGQYDFKQIGAPEGKSIMICQIKSGTNGQTDYHALVITSANDYWLDYQDLQCGGDGRLYRDSDGSFINCGGDVQFKVLSVYKQK